MMLTRYQTIIALHYNLDYVAKCTYVVALICETTTVYERMPVLHCRSIVAIILKYVIDECTI